MTGRQRVLVVLICVAGFVMVAAVAYGLAYGT